MAVAGLSFRHLRVILPLVTIVVVLVIWEGSVWAFDIKGYLLPAPSIVFRELVSKFGTLMMHMETTFWEVIIGYIASIAFGLPLAMFITQSRVFEAAIYPILITTQNVPKMALAPLFVVWLGFGMTPKVLVVFLIAFFPIVIDGVVGLRAIRPEMLQLARSMGASNYQIFMMFRFPTALPIIFGGLKVAMTLAVVGAIVGEFIGGDRGLGYLLQVSAFNFQTPLLFAAIVVLVAMGMVMYLAIVAIEKLLIPWEADRLRRQESHASM